MSLSPHPRLGLPERKDRRIFKPINGGELTKTKLIVGLVASVSVLGALLMANLVTTDYGFIPVGFGFEATAGTLFAGIMLASRDLVQDALGRFAVVLIILLGTALSFAIAAPEIAIAAAVAFGAAELMDFAAYTPLRRKSALGDKRWGIAVIVSNIIGAFTDSVIFLGIAFGLSSIGPALSGQMVGKLWATLAYLLIGYLVAKIAFKYAGKRLLEVKN